MLKIVLWSLSFSYTHVDMLWKFLYICMYLLGRHDYWHCFQFLCRLDFWSNFISLTTQSLLCSLHVWKMCSDIQFCMWKSCNYHEVQKCAKLYTVTVVYFWCLLMCCSQYPCHNSCSRINWLVKQKLISPTQFISIKYSHSQIACEYMQLIVLGSQVRSRFPYL
jgi:hypothetical protein